MVNVAPSIISTSAAQIDLPLQGDALLQRAITPQRSGATQFCAIISAPFGAIGICTAAETITEIIYLPSSYSEQAPKNALAEQAMKQLLSYFSDPTYRFTLPLKPSGSAFQNKVWQAIAAIRPGQAQTYGSLAKQIGSAARAVGGACATNPFPLIIPCHRVVAANGLGGFVGTQREGYTLQVKRWLLTYEGVYSDKLLSKTSRHIAA